MFPTKWYRVALLASLPATPFSAVMANDITGPSSSESPYILRSQPGVVTKSILTAGDAVPRKNDGSMLYRMAGIPDGLGAFDNGDGTFTLLMNHELGGTSGAVRAHGAKGAFVSRWTISKGSLEVLDGEDLIKKVWAWNQASESYEVSTAPFNRFCSGDLPAVSAFYNAKTGLGYNGRIYMNGEENGTSGRAFAHFVGGALDGNSYELPHLGKLSFENVVAHPNAGNKTVVAGLDDSTPGQVYFYIGEKTASSNPLTAAGLNNGNSLG